MNFDLHILTKSGHLQPFEKLIRESTEKNINKIARAIPVDNIDFVIFDPRDDAYSYAQPDPDRGIGQYAVSSHIIYIVIDTKNQKIQEEIAGKGFLGVLAHAMYHCIRGRSMRWIRGPLLESFIVEGLAGHFEAEMTETLVSQVYFSIKGEVLDAFKEKAQKFYWNEQYNYDDWFLGGDPEIPYGYGHSLGYKIVGDYLKQHPEKRPSLLYDTQPQEFIKK